VSITTPAGAELQLRRQGGGMIGGRAPMMLLMGIKMSLTKKPMKPMIAKPIDVACAIFANSAGAGRPTSRHRGRPQRL